MLHENLTTLEILMVMYIMFIFRELTPHSLQSSSRTPIPKFTFVNIHTINHKGCVGLITMVMILLCLFISVSCNTISLIVNVPHFLKILAVLNFLSVQLYL